MWRPPAQLVILVLFLVLVLRIWSCLHHCYALRHLCDAWKLHGSCMEVAQWSTRGRVVAVVTGALTCRVPRELSCDLLAVGQDGGSPPLSSFAKLTISVEDPDRYIPTFLNEPISFFVREREPTVSCSRSVILISSYHIISYHTR